MLGEISLQWKIEGVIMTGHNSYRINKGFGVMHQTVNVAICYQPVTVKSVL